MHGLEPDFPVIIFNGARLTAVRPLTGIFYFDFARNEAPADSRWPTTFSLGVENTWRLHLDRGGVVASASGSEGPAVDAIGEFVGQQVTAASEVFEVHAPYFNGGKRETVVFTIINGKVVSVKP